MTTSHNDPYLIIAADSHAGLPTEQYRQYLEKKFHPAFDEFLVLAQAPRTTPDKSVFNWASGSQYSPVY